MCHILPGLQYQSTLLVVTQIRHYIDKNGDILIPCEA